MAGGRRKSWRELCIAALNAKDPDDLLRILQELNRVLKDEEQVRHDFRDAIRRIVRYEDTVEYRPT
jgi:hypothetical protein